MTSNGSPVYADLAEYVNIKGKELMGKTGYSPIGAVVGATFPEVSCDLRKLISNSVLQKQRKQ